MSGAHRSVAVMLGCMVLIACATGIMPVPPTRAGAQDWPQWRGPHRDGKVTGFIAHQTRPQSLVEKWKTAVGSGDATPALVGDRLFVFARQGDDEVTLCLNAADGSQIWKDKYAAQAVTGAASRHPGPRSSPAVADRKVVTLGVGGVLSCFDAATGKPVWRKDPFPKVVPMFFTASSPIIVDGLAVAQLGGKGNGAIIAYDLATGVEKWRWAGEGPEYASPVVFTAAGTKQIAALTEKSVVGVALSDGKLLWQLPFVPQRRAYNAATPIVDGATVIYTGAGRGTKAVKIERRGNGFATRELWSSPEPAPQFNTPVLKDGLLFGFSALGNLYCINAQTGRTAWVDTVRHGRGFATVLDVGAYVVALPSTAELIAFKPVGSQYEEVARIKVADTPTYAHPVIAGNRIFVKDEDAVTLWTIQ